MLEFLGGLLLAYGPPLALFLLVVARKAPLVVVSIAGSFTCLVSLLLSAVVWMAVPPLRQVLGFIVPFSVLILEAVRFASWKFFYHKLEQVLLVKSHINRDVSALGNDLHSHSLR
mmetsp:Transcript_34532/g.86748  ORF Transcript_34532/g.86748 Transcript_34532/m.86748 type:complete len:115 (-) Transcript_34532:525-869(-)